MQPKFRSHSHRNCLMIVGYFHQESIFDVPYNKNNSQDFKLYRVLRTHSHLCNMVMELFDDKFGSVLICIGKPKVSVVGESGHGSPPLTPLFLL